MKTNFDINLPTIPGKMIKFKIQDIKSKAFGSQVARFKDNKAPLTKKFIESFSNFHEAVPRNHDDQQETQANSSFYQSRQPMTENSTDFHMIIPEQKKHLINLQQQLQNQELESISRQQKDLRQHGFQGYSFTKAGRNLFKEQNDAQSGIKQQLTDNYYFTKDLVKNTGQPAPSKPKPHAVFKAQPRVRIYSRAQKSIVPGPGAYLGNPNQNAVKKRVSSQKTKKDPKEKEVNYRNFKDIITKVMLTEKQAEEEKQAEQKIVRNQFMFMTDDRDRFGQQMYPIAPRLKVPGPGSYNSMPESIESKAKKVVIVEEQRKLLKEWFNN